MNDFEYRAWLKYLNPEPDKLFKKDLEDQINISISDKEVNDRNEHY